jgi:hypothetical protein
MEMIRLSDRSGVTRKERLRLSDRSGVTRKERLRLSDCLGVTGEKEGEVIRPFRCHEKREVEVI